VSYYRRDPEVEALREALQDAQQEIERLREALEEIERQQQRTLATIRNNEQSQLGVEMTREADL
jgi:peptidoglycan hydrolase CwlO-like protein